MIVTDILTLLGFVHTCQCKIGPGRMSNPVLLPSGFSCSSVSQRQQQALWAALFPQQPPGHPAAGAWQQRVR